MLGVITILCWAVFIGGAALAIASYFLSPGYSSRQTEEHKRAFEQRRLKYRVWGYVGAVGGAILVFCSWSFVSIPSGHSGAASLWGDVQEKAYEEGLHFPVNPFYDWTIYDARQKTQMLDDVPVPSQDQLTTVIDVSIQFRIVGAMAPAILKNTGTAAQVVDVHLIPMARSLLREQGKTVERAEDFFSSTMQDQLQSALLADLSAFMEPRGVDVQEVLIRDINLPKFIDDAVQAKKEREQAVERQRAELERQRLEAQQVEVVAAAGLNAAKDEAEKIKLLADAQAEAIRKVNEASEQGGAAYVQLEALKALQAISKDPAAKVYFMNGDSTNPLPLMHMGDGLRAER